ncbi:MAG: NAD-dependent deacylase [Spirochaetes bacterium]|nr:NAD-dependent deacylase [Spirochaetota bacterium]
MSGFDSKIEDAAGIIGKSAHLVAFTGAGISVESGIPPFRGPGGLWDIYDPAHFELAYFISHPSESWATLKKIFYERFEKASPNAGHRVLARLEERGLLKAVITQNIDNLHRRAGSRNVIEYHGSCRELVCLECRTRYTVTAALLKNEDMRCGCGGLLKPDFVFFGEDIPQEAAAGSLTETAAADVMIVIGTTGEVFPASGVPVDAKRSGATIIEVNVRPSLYTNDITDFFLPGRAAEVLEKLGTLLLE